MAANPMTVADSLPSVIEQEKGIYITVMEYACGRVEDWGRYNQVSKQWHNYLCDEEQRFLDGQLRLYPVGLRTRHDNDDDTDDDNDGVRQNDKDRSSEFIFDGAFVRKTRMPSPSLKDHVDPGIVSTICEVLEAATEKFANRRSDFFADTFNGLGMFLCSKQGVYHGLLVESKREGQGTLVKVSRHRDQK